MIRVLQILVLFSWLFAMQQWAYAQSEMDASRIKILSEIEDLDLGDLIGIPPIQIQPAFGGLEDLSNDLRMGAEFSSFSKYLALNEKIEFNQDTYLKISKYLKANPNSELKEWLGFMKADALFSVQQNLENPQWSFVVEDYEAALRNFPLSPSVPRALFQLAYIKLKNSLYQESLMLSNRAIEAYGKSPLIPFFHLIKAEQYFLSERLNDALSEFSLIVRQYPKSSAAVEAAFRRAFILFKQEKVADALKTYQNLEQFHSEVFQVLSMKKETTSDEKLLDRIYYAESLYLVGNYPEASTMFQGLANLFPSNSLAPILWIRFADTFLARNRAEAALRIYEFIRSRPASGAMAQAVASLRIADTYFFLKDMRSITKNEDLYAEAFNKAKEIEHERLMALSLIKKSIFFRTNSVFPKAKDILEEYRQLFPKLEANQAWVNESYTELVEREILDHYQANDYLAALSIYLTKEQEASMDFRNIEVLLRLSQAARSLSLLAEAERILNRVIYLESDNRLRQEALLNLIDLLIERGELKKASERLRRFNFAYPKSDLKYLYERLWGDLYLKLKNPEKALKHFEDAMESAKRNPQFVLQIREVYIHLAEIYAQKLLPEKAITSYQNFLSLFDNKEAIQLGTLPFTPKDAYFSKISHYRIADLYFEMKNFTKALRAYINVRDTIKDEPYHSQAQYRIGECYLLLDDREAALKAFAEVKSEDANNLWVRAAQSYIQSVELEVKNGIRIFN